MPGRCRGGQGLGGGGTVGDRLVAEGSLVGSVDEVGSAGDVVGAAVVLDAFGAEVGDTDVAGADSEVPSVGWSGSDDGIRSAGGVSAAAGPFPVTSPRVVPPLPPEIGAPVASSYPVIPAMASPNTAAAPTARLRGCSTDLVARTGPTGAGVVAGVVAVARRNAAWVPARTRSRVRRSDCV